MCTLFFQKVCFLLQISLLCFICGTYAGVSFTLKVEGHNYEVKQAGTLNGEGQRPELLGGYGAPLKNFEKFDSQECIFLHSEKEIILFLSLLIYPVYNKKFHFALQEFVHSIFYCVK